MKLSLFTLILLFCFTLLSCNEEKASPLQEEEMVIAQLKIGPSIGYEESPMSRSNSKSELESGIYAINVFWKGKGLTTFQPYACGLFNDISEVKIGLIVGYEYRFDCTFLASSELPYNESGKYGRPFSLTKEGFIDAKVTNKLKVSINPLNENKEFHQLIYEGGAHVKADSIAYRPSNQHRYYGYGTIDFRTASTNPTATIELKRAYYTLCFTTTKDLDENDSIKIITDYTDPFYILHSSIPTYTSDKRLLTMKAISNTRTGEINKEEPMVISIYYRSAKVGIWTPVLDNYTITLQRNKNNILKISNIDTESQGNGNLSFGEGEIGGLPDEDNSLYK